MGGYWITAASDRLIYTAGNGETEPNELFSTAIDGSGTAEMLSGPMVEGGGVENFSLSPDDGYVVYMADQDTVRVVELYAAPLPDLPEFSEQLFLPVAIR